MPMPAEQRPPSFDVDRARLRSQRLREVNFQGDALRLGMNWTEEDLRKPQVLVESAYGMGHPGTFHFRGLVEEVSNGVFEAGGKPAEFVVSDICDGVVQATEGMSYSLISRDVMAAMVEIHALGHPHDGMVVVSGNDKSVPAHLLAITRCDLPAVHVPGGTQLDAPGHVTSDEMWPMGAAVRRGELAEDELELAQRGACPTCGACQFMGSASTGQVLSEALGLALPGSALVPQPLTKLLRYARAAGKQVLRLIAEDLRPRRILTREAFENAIVLHAATGGSTNALLHLPPIAQEAGVDVTIDDFDRLHRQVPVLANVKTTGRYPVEYFWYAGGVPALMLELRDLLHLDCVSAVRATGERRRARRLARRRRRLCLCTCGLAGEARVRGGSMSDATTRTREAVVIADYDYGDVDTERAIVEQAGFELIAAQCKTEDEVIEVARDAAAVVAQYAPISARVIASLPGCRVIARYGTGVDIVDVEAATAHDILVTNVPNDWCENEVADHAMALLLAVARKVNVYDRATRRGVWRWQSGAPIHRLRGSVLGLLSFGAIARAIATRAAGFGMGITAHDPFLSDEEIAAAVAGAKGVSFDELVTGSDHLVIQAPLTPQTHHLFDESQLRRMKPTAILINTARGPIVDDRALHRALSEGWIAGAGLDDIEEEPAKVRDWRPDNLLFGLDNVVITPHAAYYSEEALDTVRHFAAEEVVRVLTGRAPLSPVNADELVHPRWSPSPSP